MEWRKRRFFVGAVEVSLALLVGFGAALIPHPPVAQADGAGEPRTFTLDGGWVRGSVALGDLDGDGVPDIVVGGIDGVVHAYRGDGVKLWQYDTGSAAIEGKAAIGDVNGDGWSEVVIGVGSTFTPLAPGGVWAFAHDGAHLWHYLSGDFDGNGVSDGVYSSPALADVDGNDNGKLEIIYGGWDAHIRALNHDGTLLWEQYVRDTIWSSPAIGDIDRDRVFEIVIGSDTHWEPAFGTEDGGKLYAVNGEDGSILPGFSKQVDQVIWSSPALGDINGDGRLEIVVGTGYCWSRCDCAPGCRTHEVIDSLYGWNYTGSPLSGWPIVLKPYGYAFASPALGDLDGDGDLEIVINTAIDSDNLFERYGYVHAFHSDGSYVDGWPVLVTTPAGPGQVVHLPTQASPLLADLTGDGSLEVILPSNWEIVVWNREGHQLTRDRFPPAAEQWTLDTQYTVDGTPAVGDVDGDGKMELVVGGALAGGAQGALYVWDFDDVPADETAPWPRFRRDNVNHARYAFPPELAVSPFSLLLMHEYGSGSSESGTLWVANRGDGEVDWQIDSHPPTATVTPCSGTVDWGQQAVDITVSVDGYHTGTHSIGEVVVSGVAEGDVVSGSPVTVPITLYVGPVHHLFMPLITRRGP